jgi:hypothetical protein
MGCSGSSNAVKKPANGGKKVGKNAEPQPAGPKRSVTKMDKKIAAPYIKTDEKTGKSKLTLDLQFKADHCKFIETVAGGTTSQCAYERFDDIDSVDILISSDKEQVNKNLVEVLKNQFPAKVNSFTIKSLAKEPVDIKPFIEAIKFSKTHIKDEFNCKNFAIHGTTMTTLLEAVDQTSKVIVFGATFHKLNGITVSDQGKYTIQSLSIMYSREAEKVDSCHTHVISAIAKNKALSTSLKTLEFAHNKLGEEAEAKKAMTDNKLNGVKLVFKYAAKKVAKASVDEDDEEYDEDEDEDADEDENEDDEDENEDDEDEDEASEADEVESY